MPANPPAKPSNKSVAGVSGPFTLSCLFRCPVLSVGTGPGTGGDIGVCAFAAKAKPRASIIEQITIFFILFLFLRFSFNFFSVLVKQQVELFNRLQKYDTSKQFPNHLIFKEIDLTFELFII